MWTRRQDDHHTFHTCSAALMSVSYTYEPAFSIFFLALMALFTSSCASITAFPFCIESTRRGEGGEKWWRTYFEQSASVQALSRVLPFWLPRLARTWRSTSPPPPQPQQNPCHSPCHPPQWTAAVAQAGWCPPPLSWSLLSSPLCLR